MTWRQIVNGCLSCHLTWLHVHDVSTIRFSTVVTDRTRKVTRKAKRAGEARARRGARDGLTNRVPDAAVAESTVLDP